MAYFLKSPIGSLVRALTTFKSSFKYFNLIVISSPLFSATFELFAEVDCLTSSAGVDTLELLVDGPLPPLTLVPLTLLLLLLLDALALLLLPPLVLLLTRECASRRDDKPVCSVLLLLVLVMLLLYFIFSLERDRLWSFLIEMVPSANTYLAFVRR